jgi:hypothetical protein
MKWVNCYNYLKFLKESKIISFFIVDAGQTLPPKSSKSKEGRG